jgi:Mg2+ and Co2+ transporter CorA
VRITCVALEPDGGMRPETEAAALARWRGGGGPYWIHLGGGSPDEVTAWLAGLGLGPELLEVFRVGSDETRIVPLGEAAFVAYPVPAAGDAWEPVHLGILCLERLVVTVQPAGSTLLEEAPLAKLKISEGTPAGLVCGLALLHASRLRHHVVALRREGDVLADRMDSDPGAVPLREILATKRRALMLGGVVDEQLAVLEVLKVSKLPVLPLHGLADRFQVAIELARATDRDVERLERRATDLQHRYESALQEKTNRRLGTLTVLSAIFMPLTLIAGIYGMNFEVMPELHYRYGYPLVLAGMALLAGGLVWYFRTRWWTK